MHSLILVAFLFAIKLISLWHGSASPSVSSVFSCIRCALSKKILLPLLEYAVLSNVIKTNSLTYALTDPHGMLVVSGYAGITRQAMHGSHRLPDLVRDEGK